FSHGAASRPQDQSRPAAGAETRRDPPRRHRRLRRTRLLQRTGGRRRRRGRHRLPLLPQQGRPAGVDLRAEHEGGARRRTRGHREDQRSARTPAALRASASRPPGTRPESGDRVPGRAAPVDEVHGALLLDAAPRLPRPHPQRDRRRAARRAVPRRHQADRGGEGALRRARRDGDELDSEPAPLRARTRSRRRPRSVPARRQNGADAMTSAIRSVAVLGAGTMGAQIAAHVANAGLPALLLDLTPDVAAQGLKRVRSLKPDPFFTKDTAALVTTGGFDVDLAKLADADWIVEAVVEQIDVKRRLFERVDACRRPGSIVSTNTSGIPVHTIAEGRSAEFRRQFLGTHFFNPPRYLHLVELIPTADTDASVVDRMKTFLDVTLGKGVVVAKDSPNFIANRIGVYGVVQVLRAIESGEFTIEEVDAITGPALGRPNSATFRTLDIAGVDILAHVARNLGLELPPFVNEMIARGWIGEKAGQGFYKKVAASTGSGRAEIWTLDPTTLEYRPKQPAKLASLEAARAIEDVGERTKALFDAKDHAGAFLRATLAPTIEYAAAVAPDVAYSPDDVDRAMRWGFGWEIGPLALAQVLRGASTGAAVTGTNLRTGARVVRKNAGASLVDLGDGVLAVTLHSKMNAIGADTVQMLHAGVAEAAANFAALVVGTDAPNFSAGANLMLLLLEAQEGNWDEIDAMVRAFQAATLALRASRVPVVAAVAGRALGGGCEIVMHADRVQAAADSFIGLVEVGVGLIPAGGGTKEMLARATAHLASAPVDLLPHVQQVF